MRRFKLTKAAKILIMVLVLALVGGGVFAGVKTGLVTIDGKDKANVETNNDKSNKKDTASLDYDENGNVMNLDKETDATINLSLDEWIG